jgi:hypothetical protein
MIANARIVAPTPIPALAPVDKPCRAGGLVEVGFVEAGCVGDVFVEVPVGETEMVVRLRSELLKLSWNIGAYLLVSTLVLSYWKLVYQFYVLETGKTPGRGLRAKRVEALT